MAASNKRASEILQDLRRLLKATPGVQLHQVLTRAVAVSFTAANHDKVDYFVTADGAQLGAAWKKPAPPAENTFP